MAKQAQPADVQVGDIVVSNFGNWWQVEQVGAVYSLRNRIDETPDTAGTLYTGPFPEWANRIERRGLRVWERRTPQCECATYEKAKGPYPSGICPDCGLWYPGVTRQKAIERGDIPAGEPSNG